MSAGLRNQRLRLYRRVNHGSDGLVSPVFVFTGEWWGRLEELRSNVYQSNARNQMTTGAAAEFADEVDVPAVGIVVNTGDNRAWWIRGITHATSVRRKLVQVERINDEEFTTLKMYDSDDQLMGTHLVNPE